VLDETVRATEITGRLLHADDHHDLADAGVDRAELADLASTPPNRPHRAGQAAQGGARVDAYLRANPGRIPNYGERYRWTPRGAHLLLQVRTRVLNDQLAGDFRRWIAATRELAPS
jgi:hypothetical protein